MVSCLSLLFRCCEVLVLYFVKLCFLPNYISLFRMRSIQYILFSLLHICSYFLDVLLELFSLTYPLLVLNHIILSFLWYLCHCPQGRIDKEQYHDLTDLSVPALEDFILSRNDTQFSFLFFLFFWRQMVLPSWVHYGVSSYLWQWYPACILFFFGLQQLHYILFWWLSFKYLNSFLLTNFKSLTLFR